MAFSPQQTILELGEAFYDPVEAAAFPKAILRFRNDRAAAQVGLADLDDDRWIAHFARFEPLPGSLARPLALRYHGHQFRVYNPDIGDGRGFLFAQLREGGGDGRGRLLDLGTKGSGTTPYSRFGDGRLTLKGGVREVLATEMLEALGVETSRSFSLIETGEALVRGDEPSPTRSSVLVRLSHGHIRIGTFQRLAYFGQEAEMARLAAYVLRHLHGEEPGAEPALQLLGNVVARTARLAGRFMAAGFVHGVLNSDNINVTGESFDYGPWRWAPEWDPAFTAAYFDQQGLHAFGRQPEAIYWDAMQLAASLTLIAPQEELAGVLEGFGARYQEEVAAALLWRLGVVPRGAAEDSHLIAAMERALNGSGVGLDRFFFDFFGGARPAGYPARFDGFAAQLAAYAPRKSRDHPYWRNPEPCAMLIDEVEAIWAAIDREEDWAPFTHKIAAVRAMGDALK
ncbi:protein adenylyltransferase SelO family protein [Sphingomonas canadensis]|uniref:Protein adenylyltransferase SelO family protein n=1 Tax=Sphingomonas canadensis TaxID=1219257 RepID=A0ABW3HDA1_9SPHN|nr:YdiU family protein [Sphingomonas canadensis]MCW3838056.1 YdiU family protein [Sphingomonas canadensis]